MARPIQSNSLRSIAKATGVSATTVSRVLKGSSEVGDRTRRTVLAAARRAGYDAAVAEPTRSRGASLQAPWIAIVYTGGYLSADSAYDTSVLAGVQRGLAKTRYGVAMLHLDRGPEAESRGSYRAFFAQRGIAGALLRTNAQTRAVCPQIAAEGFPCIALAERFEDAEPAVPYVCCDSGPPSHAAVSHLIHLGHRRIALLTARMPDRDHQDRIDAYRRALDEAGLPRDERLEIHLRPRVADGATAIRQLLALPDPPTAAFVTDPDTSLGVIQKLHEMKVSVPGRFSVVGFDDGHMRHTTHPRLTAVCQDAADLGAEAAQRLNRLLLGQPQASISMRIPAQFEIHDSVAPPPQ
ncbi:MAG: LacI family DNA-binding transcriptional regulator [Planctomycetota bacterium]